MKSSDKALSFKKYFQSKWTSNGPPMDRLFDQMWSLISASIDSHENMWWLTGVRRFIISVLVQIVKDKYERQYECWSSYENFKRWIDECNYPLGDQWIYELNVGENFKEIWQYSCNFHLPKEYLKATWKWD